METIMTIDNLRSFFMWCSIINVVLMLISWLMFVVAKNGIYKIHSKWFPMPQEKFNAIWYQFLAFYKIGTFLLNIVPFIALCIIA